MLTAAIIAEYNPFHQGHAYHIAKTRELGATHIAVIMSGDFVQRADAAILPKRVRAKLAIENGADLVLELDAPHATATAEYFAKGALYLADALGCVQALSFGCEEGDLAILERAAAALDAPDTRARLKSYLAEGMSFAAARSRALRDTGGTDLADLLAMPNTILALEYLRAIRQGGYQIAPWPVRRFGAGHDAPAPYAGIASASYLRALMTKPEGGVQAASSYLPGQAAALLPALYRAGEAPASLALAERAVLARLRSFSSPQDFTRYFDVVEGLENRLFAAAGKACSLAEFYDLVKSKRYTHARIRRIVLHAFLDLQRESLLSYPPYLRPLALGRRGAEILRKAKLPVISRYADLNAYLTAGCPFAAAGRHAARLYGLCTPAIRPGDKEESLFPLFVDQTI